jgi:hypothetical protein
MIVSVDRSASKPIRRPAVWCLALCAVLSGTGGGAARGQTPPIAWVELGP